MRIKRKLKRGGFPNDNMRKCADDALFVGVISWLVVSPVVALVSSLAEGLVVGPFVGLFVGLGVGLVGGLSAGGFSCLRYCSLRLWLTRNRSTPWSYVKFLDYAADRILLRRVGGGYMFIHRMLMDYFAARYVEPSTAGTPHLNSPAIEDES